MHSRLFQAFAQAQKGFEDRAKAEAELEARVPIDIDRFAEEDYR